MSDTSALREGRLGRLALPCLQLLRIPGLLALFFFVTVAPARAISIATVFTSVNASFGCVQLNDHHQNSSTGIAASASFVSATTCPTDNPPGVPVGGTANAVASVREGILTVRAQAEPFRSQADAIADMNLGTFVIRNTTGFTRIGYLDVDITGGTNNAASGLEATGTFLSNVFWGIVGHPELDPRQSWSFNLPPFPTPGGPVNTILRHFFSFGGGVFGPQQTIRENVSFELTAHAVQGGLSDFSHTATMFLTLDEGLVWDRDPSDLLFADRPGAIIVPGQVVPEPSTLVLGAAGLVALAMKTLKRHGRCLHWLIESRIGSRARREPATAREDLGELGGVV
jgi:hypothetical protein